MRIRAVHAEDATYGAPRITAELNDGTPRWRAGEPQAGGVGDARHGGSPATDVNAGCALLCPIRPTRKSLTCWIVTSPLRCRTSSISEISPICRWPAGEPKSGDGHRLLFTAG